MGHGLSNAEISHVGLWLQCAILTSLVSTDFSVKGVKRVLTAIRDMLFRSAFRLKSESRI